jgi:hypothetical protein
MFLKRQKEDLENMLNKFPEGILLTYTLAD